MRSTARLRSGRVVPFALLAACAAPGPPSVPVAEEPRHRLVSDLEFAQVLDVRILGSDTTLFHTHANPIAYACVGGAPVATQAIGEEWSPPGEPCRSGTAFSNPEYVSAPLTHRVANTGLDVFHLIAVQSLRDASSRTALGRVAAGSPLVDNAWFRALAVDVRPGGAIPPHRHDVATLLVLTTGSGIVSVGDGGENILVEPGAWAWLQPGEHELTAGDGVAGRIIEIEVK